MSFPVVFFRENGRIAMMVIGRCWSLNSCYLPNFTSLPVSCVGPWFCGKMFEASELDRTRRGTRKRRRRMMTIMLMINLQRTQTPNPSRMRILAIKCVAQGGPKMAPVFVRLITSPNINRFSNFFHCQNQETVCNKTVTIDPITPKVCHYTTL